MKHHPSSYDIKEDVFQLIQRSGIEVEGFRAKTILITGGTGFFGIWTLSALVEIKKSLGGDLRLIALSRNAAKFLGSNSNLKFGNNIEFISGNVINFEIKGVKVTHLIHMAATNAGETFAGEEQINKLNMLYVGTKNILEQCGESLEKVLFTSSGATYGNSKSPFISEDDFTGPDTTEIGSALAIGKLAAEYLVSYYAQKLDYKFSIARCFAFAGQYLPMDVHYAFGNFVLDAIEARNIVIHGDGHDVRSYLYIGDAVAWMLRLLAEPRNQMFNVGSEKQISMERLAVKIASISKKSIGISVLNHRPDVGNFRRNSYIPSTKKILSAYPSLNEWTSVEEMASKMLKI